MSRFERVMNQRIYQKIVDQITRLVRDGVLRPGDQLPPERQLAEEFGVSRTAVREALSALTVSGLLEVRPGEGTFVRSVSLEGLVAPLALLLTIERDDAAARELLEVRSALESENAYLAAQRRDSDDLAEMEAAFRDMTAEPASRAADDADWRFHHAIASAAGNSLILDIMHSLRELMQEGIRYYRQMLLRMPGMDAVLLQEHQEILDAIRDQDPNRAADRMRAHIEGVKRHLGDSLGHHSPALEGPGEPEHNN